MSDSLVKLRRQHGKSQTKAFINQHQRLTPIGKAIKRGFCHVRIFNRNINSRTAVRKVDIIAKVVGRDGNVMGKLLRTVNDIMVVSGEVPKEVDLHLKKIQR